jgi:cell filamentation protein
MAKYYDWKDYYIPGTEVLQNRFNETDPVKLKKLEESKVRGRMLLLVQQPIRGNFDFTHMKAIHKFLFQDVYEWAGEERTAPSFGEPFMNKEGHEYFPAGEPLTNQLNKLYGELADKNYLVGLPLDVFAKELANSWCEINVAHAFREGNTRSQFIFFSELAKHAGYQLDASALAADEKLRQEIIDARNAGHAPSKISVFADVLRKVIKPLPPIAQDDSKDSGIILDKDSATSLGVDVMSIVPTVDGDAG